jgi:hypothetical protein
MNEPHTRLPLLALAGLALLLLSGCLGENEQFIQGTWEYNDAHLAEIVSESDLTVVWYFSAGTFTYQACCFNLDLEFGGRYRILDSTGDVMTLELYNTFGTGSRMDGEIRIELDRAAGTLNIQGTEPFYKLGP